MDIRKELSRIGIAVDDLTDRELAKLPLRADFLKNKDFVISYIEAIGAARELKPYYKISNFTAQWWGIWTTFDGQVMFIIRCVGVSGY